MRRYTYGSMRAWSAPRREIRQRHTRDTRERRVMRDMKRDRGEPAAQAEAARASEGRWPRICERDEAHDAPAARWCGMCGRIAMLSLHTSPLADLGRTRDAGGMNVYVRELSRELGRGGMGVDIFTRRSDPTLPLIQPLGNQV